MRCVITGKGDGKRFVLQFMDAFNRQGPNGSHLCVVTELSAPSPTMNLRGLDREEEELTPEIAKSFALQAAKGVKYLHSCNIIHGGQIC